MHLIRFVTAACLVATLVASQRAGSGDAAFEVVGGFGFDWLAPQSAQCARITPADAKKFRSCEFNSSGAFGLPLAYHACSVAKKSEILVFKTSDACEEALATMHANEP